MTKDDGKRFNDALTRMTLIFPDRNKVGPDGKVKADVTNLYWSALRPYSIEQVEGAMQHIQNTQTESFFPVPGKIVDTIKTHFPNKPYSYGYDSSPQTPENPAGATYMIYCLRKGKEWDWAEFSNFKLDFLAGKVQVNRVNEQRGNVLFAGTQIVWNRE